MDGRSLYATILGLEAAWEVERVELKTTERVVHVWVQPRDGTSFVSLSAARRARSTITPSGAGAIWIPDAAPRVSAARQLHDARGAHDSSAMGREALPLHAAL